jgi:hypothetical protein
VSYDFLRLEFGKQEAGSHAIATVNGRCESVGCRGSGLLFCAYAQISHGPPDACAMREKTVAHAQRVGWLGASMHPTPPRYALRGQPSAVLVVPDKFVGPGVLIVDHSLRHIKKCPLMGTFHF